MYQRSDARWRDSRGKSAYSCFGGHGIPNRTNNGSKRTHNKGRFANKSVEPHYGREPRSETTKEWEWERTRTDKTYNRQPVFYQQSMCEKKTYATVVRNTSGPSRRVDVSQAKENAAEARTLTEVMQGLKEINMEGEFPTPSTGAIPKAPAAPYPGTEKPDACKNPVKACTTASCKDIATKRQEVTKAGMSEIIESASTQEPEEQITTSQETAGASVALNQFYTILPEYHFNTPYNNAVDVKEALNRFHFHLKNNRAVPGQDKLKMIGNGIEHLGYKIELTARRAARTHFIYTVLLIDYYHLRALCSDEQKLQYRYLYYSKSEYTQLYRTDDFERVDDLWKLYANESVERLSQTRETCDAMRKKIAPVAYPFPAPYFCRHLSKLPEQTGPSVSKFHKYTVRLSHNRAELVNNEEASSYEALAPPGPLYMSFQTFYRLYPQ